MIQRSYTQLMSRVFYSSWMFCILRKASVEVEEVEEAEEGQEEAWEEG